MLYTVDEVSDLLGVPRPTLYRYLREYSVPYERHAGRISIPEESLDRIRRVRELHDEGLGTAAVRRRLDEAEASEIDRISERLDRLSEEIERSRATEATMSSAQALHVVLARQSLLISAVYDLTRMVEELLEANGRPRTSSLDYLEDSPTNGVPLSPTGRRGAESPSEQADADLSIPHERFGTLARRRRLAVGVVSILILVLALLWAALTFSPAIF